MRAAGIGQERPMLPRPGAVLPDRGARGTLAFRRGDADMERAIHIIDQISTWVGKVFAWCVIVLMVAICYEVFLRYVLRTPTAWVYDFSYMMYGTLFMMAGAYALSSAAHVRGDVIYRLFPVPAQAWLDLFLFLLFFFPAAIALLFAGYHYAEYSWRIGERSSSSPGGPPVYHFKTVIPITAVFLLLQGIAELLRCVQAIRTGIWPARETDVAEVDPEMLAEYAQMAAFADARQADVDAKKAEARAAKETRSAGA
jgi:TRAP-type mannitol/chloroaromatic compound transport system permease small subunit